MTRHLIYIICTVYITLHDSYELRWMFCLKLFIHHTISLYLNFIMNIVIRRNCALQNTKTVKLSTFMSTKYMFINHHFNNCFLNVTRSTCMKMILSLSCDRLRPPITVGSVWGIRHILELAHALLCLLCSDSFV